MRFRSISATSRPTLRARGIALVLTMMFLPVMFLLVISTGKLMMGESSFAKQEQGNGRVFYMAEAGITAASHAYAASNFGRYTHDANDAVIASGMGSLRLAPTVTGFTSVTSATTLYDGTVVQPGWHLWRWNPGDSPASSYSGSGLPEAIYYKVRQLGGENWQIESRAQFGNFHRANSLQGKYEPAFYYAIFDAADLSEFVRGADQTLNGKIHANGNLFMRPSDTLLTLKSTTDSLTDLTIHAAGKIIRDKDAWNRPTPSNSRVKIAKAGNNSNLVDMNQVDGAWFGSDHAKWLNATSGALSTFGSVIRDGALGAVTKDPPSLQSMDTTGYYAQNAGLKITSTTPNSTWLSSVTFYNKAEGRYIEAKKLDVSALGGTFPTNGLIYSEVPLIVDKAATLPASTTIVGNQAVYTHGDFNKNSNATATAAIMTRERIYHTSDDYVFPSSPPSTQTKAKNTEIYSALIDSTITVDERPYVASHKGVTNPHDSDPNITANSDDLLENWGSDRTLKKRGTIMHLQNAVMANFENSNLGPGVCPWIVDSFYTPPTRDYGYDPRLVTVPPPFSPVISNRGYWVSTSF